MEEYIKSFDKEKGNEREFNDKELITQEKIKTINEKIIKLKPEMKILDIFNQYPGLKDYMYDKSEKFKMLKSPIFKFIGKIATVKMVSEKSGYSLDILQKEFTKYIESLKE